MLKRSVLIFFVCVLTFFSCVSQTVVRKGAMPAWVNNVYSMFNESQFVAATGYGADRAAAEANALAALTAFFGQTVQIDRSAASFYRQAITDGVMDGWVDTAEMRTNIRSTSTFDNLMGAEIKEVWFDSKDLYYAAAVIEKSKGIKIYSELIKANQNIINNLVSMTSAEKNSMEGALRYRFAAAAADINVFYRNIVILLGGKTDDTNSGDYFRLEAQNIIKSIPVHIRIMNDRNGRIFSAFAGCFADWGFETAAIVPPARETAFRYALDVNISLSPVELPANPNIFSRIELTANLTDTHNNHILIPYSFNSREGHATRSEAENRCVLAAERNIGDVFANMLNDCLTRLRPKN
ncbi:MAG: hypothetical protein FWB77_02125 [Treponema sp.]|nr:hypothetical protein [Treponema sp.]